MEIVEIERNGCVYEFEAYKHTELRDFPKEHGIYAIYNTVNGKMIPGQTIYKTGFYQRWGNHLRAYKRGSYHNRYVVSAFKKYGLDKFRFLILERLPPEAKINDEREIFWINEFNTLDRNFGYSLQPGGSNKRHTKQSANNIRKALLKAHPRRGVKIPEQEVFRMSIMKTVPYPLINPEGKLVYIISPRGFPTADYSRGFRFLRYGKIKLYNGWSIPTELRDLTEEENLARLNPPPDRTPHFNSKEYWFYKNNQLIKIIGLKPYCRENKLSFDYMTDVYYGLRTAISHRGYTSARNEQLAQNGVKE